VAQQNIILPSRVFIQIKKKKQKRKENKEKTKKNNGRAPLALRGRRSLVA